MGGPDMGGLILYGACNGGPGIVRNVPNPARYFTQVLIFHSGPVSITITFFSKCIILFAAAGYFG